VIEKIIVENISGENNNTEYITKKEYCAPKKINNFFYRRIEKVKRCVNLL
jgi:hypothetical protein